MKFIEHRVTDRRILRLIQKYMRRLETRDPGVLRRGATMLVGCCTDAEGGWIGMHPSNSGH